jgi:aminoglycoside phosphotransferase (APT) family kinase protein
LPAVDVLRGGFSNALFRLTFPSCGDSFVLRLYRQGSDVATVEVALLRLLAGRVPVPKLIFADPHGVVAGTPLAVMSYVDGILLDRALAEAGTEDVREMAPDAGRVLADIGRHTFAGCGFFAPDLTPLGEPYISPDAFLTFVHEYLFHRIGPSVLEQRVRDRYWALLQDEAPRLTAVEGARSLVHADYNGKNILVGRRGEGWEIRAVLDWEFALASTPLLDVGNMLRFSHRMHPAFARAFAEGYLANDGSLPEDWPQLARLLDVYALCQFLARGPDAPFFHDVRAIVRATAERGSI